MLENIFVKYPEFISTDPRILRKDHPSGAYNIDADFQFWRHQITLPADKVDGLSVLDLGCCVGASGAWVLSNNARRYVGVELQANFCKLANENLSLRFPSHNWEIKELSFTDFFADNTEKFDVVIAFGVLYHSIYFETLIKNILGTNPSLVLIDSVIPNVLKQLPNRNTIDKEVINYLSCAPIVDYRSDLMVSEVPGYTVESDQAYPSLSVVQILMSAEGFELVDDTSDTLGKLFPKKYQGRYCGIFKKTNRTLQIPRNFEKIYTEPYEHLLRPFNTTVLNNPWVFNNSIADNFGLHARQHIPDYDKVIDQCISISSKLISNPNEDRIIDVGSAVGETVKRFYGAGFHNMVGVEASQDMLNKVNNLEIAHWIHSDQFPIASGPYHAVLCNWTMHFIKDKSSYLTDIYQGLIPGGFLILSDKTHNTGIDLELYHDIKRAQGVSEQDIVAKAVSVKDIMFINEPNWYLKQLTSIGFDSVSIINAAPCFTTFLAVKKPA